MYDHFAIFGARLFDALRHGDSDVPELRDETSRKGKQCDGHHRQHDRLDSLLHTSMSGNLGCPRPLVHRGLLQ